MSWLPSPLLEASNGALLFILAAMLVGDVRYVLRDWVRIGGVWGVYQFRKAAVALSVFLGGLVLRTAVIWWLQHQRNLGHPEPAWSPAAPWILIAATVAAVVGGMCWLRVTSNRSQGRWWWAWLSIGAVAFGLGMAVDWSAGLPGGAHWPPLRW